MEGFFSRFDGVRLVRDGVESAADVRGRDGSSVLKQKGHGSTGPGVVTPIAVSGIARPGEVITILPGEYSGSPAPVVTRQILRDGQPPEAIEALSLPLTPADLGATIEIVETATNQKGSVQSSAAIEVAIWAPSLITASPGAAALLASDAVPLDLAVLSADGAQPLDWTIVAGGDGMALDISGVEPVLRLVAMPATGQHVTTIRAENAAGAATIEFGLDVAPGLSAPSAISMAATSAEVTEGTVLPIDLTVLSCDGSAPISWSVPSGGEVFAIDTSGEQPVLQLLQMPVPGSHMIAVEAANEMGAITADFVLNVGVGTIATTQIMASPQSAALASDTALPAALAILTADGTGPIAWSMVSGEAYCALEILGSQATLMLVAMPKDGTTEILVEAANAAGVAQGRFSVTVHQALVAPTAVAVQAGPASVRSDAALPVDLATLGADGTTPLNWSLTIGAPYVELDQSGAAPVLRLIEMPAPGPCPIEVEASNEAGAARAALALMIEAAIQQPGQITLSAADARVGAGDPLPLALAELSSDGTPPLLWSVVAGAQFCSIETVGETPVLQLVAMPVEGATEIVVEAANEAGAARASFALSVESAQRAPTAVTLSSTAATIGAKATLPLDLATLDADGTAPLSWQLIAGAPHFEIDTGRAAAVLRLIGMPAAGNHSAEVEAANAAGSARAAFTLSVEAEQVIAVNEGTVGSVVTNEDGSISFDLTGSAHDGSYVISAAAAQQGYPQILVPPTLATDATGWSVNGDGLYAWPVADPASVLVHWESGGSIIGTGPTMATAPTLADDRIEAVLRLINVAADLPAEQPMARIVAQVGSTWPASPLIMSDTQSKATIDTTGAADVQRLVIGMWGVKQGSNLKYPLRGNITGGTTQLLAIEEGYGTGAAGVRGCFTSINGGVLKYDRVLAGFGYAPGDRFCCIWTAEVGQPVRGFGSRNGGSQMSSSTAPIPAGSTIRVETAELRINSGWTGIRDRIAIWSPASIPDLTDPAVWYEFVDREGRMKDPARADALLGAPLLDDRGTAATFDAGTHYGSWNAGVFTVTAAAADYVE